MENVRIVHVFVATLSQCLKYLPEHHKLWLLGTRMHLCFQRNILLNLPYLLSSLVLPGCFFPFVFVLPQRQMEKAAW